MPLQALRDRAGAREDPGVESEAADVRGWEARTLIDDQHTGAVAEVLADERHVPCWVLVQPDGAPLIALPVGLCRADRDHHVLWLAGLDAQRAAGIPQLHGDPPDRHEEGLLLAALDAVLAGGAEERIPPRVEGGDDAAAPIHRLIPLADRDDYVIPDTESDPRGWCVIARGGRQIGTVEDLIVDTTALRVAYLLCESAEHDQTAAPEPSGRFLLDAGAVRLLPSRGIVAARAAVEGGGGRIAYAGEESLRGLEEAMSPESGFYERSWFDARRCFGEGVYEAESVGPA